MGMNDAMDEVFARRNHPTARSDSDRNIMADLADEADDDDDEPDFEAIVQAKHDRQEDAFNARWPR